MFTASGYKQEDVLETRRVGRPGRWRVGAAAVLLASATIAIVLLLRGNAASSSIRASYTGGRTLSGDALLRASASAGAGIVAVDFYVDGRLAGTSTAPPYELDVTPGTIDAGQHIVWVVATDARGRAGASSKREVVFRAPPKLRPISPSRFGAILHVLAAGHVTVRLSDGRFPVDGASLGPGTRLVGEGAKTILQAPSDSYQAALSITGSSARVSNLSIDGGGPGAGPGDAIAIQPGVSDIRISGVQITRVRGIGVHALGGNGSISVQSSRIFGDARASAGVFIADGSSDASVVRTEIRHFRDWGVNFVHVPTGDANAIPGVLALDDTISAINDPSRADGTNEGAIWSGGTRASIIGNTITSTGWDGIETVGSSLGVSVVGNRISQTPTGIYVEHSTSRSLFASNRIEDVGTGINVEWTQGGVGSDGNAFVSNSVTTASRGLFVDVGDNGNTIAGNTFVGVSAPVTLQGSSDNQVRGNRACGSTGKLVSQTVGLRDDRSVAYATNNRLLGNDSMSCQKVG